MPRWNSHLLDKTNLRLLAKQLATLAETPYFNSRLEAYLGNLQDVINRLLDRFDSIPSQTAHLITQEIWSVTQFLAGSTSKTYPYEITYGLGLALKEWTNTAVEVTTAVIHEQSFYFRGVPPEFKQYVAAYLGIKLETDLVQIALPEIYRQRPLYNVALYHELGHFLDRHLGITEMSLLTHSPKHVHLLPEISSRPKDMSSAVYAEMNKRYRREFFADLFAASYTGYAFDRFLYQFAPNHSASHSHPATHHRLQQIKALLYGKKTRIIDMFNFALAILRRPTLTVRFKMPKLKKHFDNVRPYEIRSDSEVHGILGGAWEYLERAQIKKGGPWKNLDDPEIERIINDLVEKSIRNRMIVERWNNESTR